MRKRSKEGINHAVSGKGTYVIESGVGKKSSVEPSSDIGRARPLPRACSLDRVSVPVIGGGPGDVPNRYEVRRGMMMMMMMMMMMVMMMMVMMVMMMMVMMVMMVMMMRLHPICDLYIVSSVM
jgi:hypothetical protein